MKGKGSKNNVANRGAKAKVKYYSGKPVKEIQIRDRKNGISIMGAQYDNGDIVKSPDGGYVKYSSIQEFAPDQA